MSAQPIEYDDPLDPQVIAAELPESLREVFLGEYRAAVDVAHDPVGYRGLQRVLRRWKVRSRLEGTRQRLRDGVVFVPASAVLQDPEGGAAGGAAGGR